MFTEVYYCSYRAGKQCNIAAKQRVRFAKPQLNLGHAKYMWGTLGGAAWENCLCYCVNDLCQCQPTTDTTTQFLLHRCCCCCLSHGQMTPFVADF